MASWRLAIKFNEQLYTFTINANTNYNDLIQKISSHYAIGLTDYFLEVYDAHFRRYIILDEEYFTILQDRLLRSDCNALNGRIVARSLPSQNSKRDSTLNHRKKKRTSSFSSQIDLIIIWLDSYIGHSDNGRYLKHKFIITTSLDIARSMLDYEICIDDLIQINSKVQNHKNILNIFNNKDECITFLEKLEPKIKILFITSNIFCKEIVPSVSKRVDSIYILNYDEFFSYDWAFDYKTKLLIFNDDLSLLIRLIRDLAKNFLEKAEAISKSSLKHAMTFSKWARQLYNRANVIDNLPYSHVQNSIDYRLKILESYCMDKHSDKIMNHELDDKFALECDEG